MNEALWFAIREYIDAEIKLGIARNTARMPGLRFDGIDDEIKAHEEQSTRMKTAIREMLS